MGLILLDKAWPGLFKTHVINEQPAGKAAKRFGEDFGQPTKNFIAQQGCLYYSKGKLFR